jgi:hypothetical protein
LPYERWPKTPHRRRSCKAEVSEIGGYVNLMMGRSQNSEKIVR